LSHAIGFDDAPFAREWRGDVRIFGAVYAGPTLHAVVSGRVRRDGRNATDELSRLVTAQAEHLQLVFLQGIALAGFNVVDLGALHARTGLPVLVVARRKPRLDRIRRALLEEVPGGARKWRLIEQAGEMEPCAGWGSANGVLDSKILIALCNDHKTARTIGPVVLDSIRLCWNGAEPV